MINLSKSLTHGLLAVASVGAILTLSEAAKAFTVGQVRTPGFSTVVEDKTYSDFVFTGGYNDSHTININFVQPPIGTKVYQLQYDAGIITPIVASGTISYKVTIGTGFLNVFDKAGTDVNGSDLSGGSYAKTLDATNLSPSPIDDTQTGIFSAGTKTITVTSTWTAGGGAYISQFSDYLIQNPESPTPVPEPLTILGTGVVLGALPALKKEYAKRKKKKDGNA